MKFGCCINFDKYDILVDIGFDFIELSGAVIHDLDEFEFSNINGIIGNNKVKCCGFNSLLRPDIKVVGNNINKKSNQIIRFRKIKYLIFKNILYF